MSTPSTPGVSALGVRSPLLRLVPGIPLAVLATIVLLAGAAPYLTPFSPVQNDLVNRLIPPMWVDGGSALHILGTDAFGRDVLTRLLYGARVSMAVAVFALMISAGLGSLVGISAGYGRGWVDSILMRLVDVMLGLPTLLIGIVAAIVLGPSFRNLVLVLGLLSWPRIARLLRGETLILKQTEFVRYAEAIRVNKRSIVSRHILPNVFPTLSVATTLELGSVVLGEAALSFVGAGIPAPQASWGVMISEGQALASSGWWIALFPGLALGVTVLCCNTLGDWLRDYFDPKSTLKR